MSEDLIVQERIPELLSRHGDFRLSCKMRYSQGTPVCTGINVWRPVCGGASVACSV